MTSVISPQDAAAAAKEVIEFYDSIPAINPQKFAAGLAALFSTYPQPVIARAIDPRGGIPANVEKPNLARIKRLLDGWYDEHFQDVRRQQSASRDRLPAPPPPDEETKVRVREGFQQLKAALKAGNLP